MVSLRVLCVTLANSAVKRFSVVLSKFARSTPKGTQLYVKPNPGHSPTPRRYTFHQRGETWVHKRCLSKCQLLILLPNYANFPLPHSNAPTRLLAFSRARPSHRTACNRI